LSQAASGLISGFSLQSKLFGDTGPYDLFRNNSNARADGPGNNLPNACGFVAASSQHLSQDAVLLDTVLAGDWWLSGWIYLSTATAFMAVASKGSGSTSWELRLNAAGDNLLLLTPDTSATVSTTLSAETWYFIEAGKVGGRIYCGVDGVFALSASPALNVVTTDFSFGSRSGSAIFWNGRMAQMMLRRTRLTEAQRHWLVNNGQGRDLTHAV
jgi:hypothetical protein